MADSDSEEGSDHWCVATADDFPPERKKNENKTYASNNRYIIIQTVGGWAGSPSELTQCHGGQIPPGRSDSGSVDRFLQGGQTVPVRKKSPREVRQFQGGQIPPRRSDSAKVDKFLQRGQTMSGWTDSSREVRQCQVAQIPLRRSDSARADRFL